MTLIETKIKRWGNSFGVIIPKETIQEASLREEENVRLILVKKSKQVLKSTFGIGKAIKQSGQELKDASRRELY